MAIPTALNLQQQQRQQQQQQSQQPQLQQRRGREEQQSPWNPSRNNVTSTDTSDPGFSGPAVGMPETAAAAAATTTATQAEEICGGTRVNAAAAAAGQAAAAASAAAAAAAGRQQEQQPFTTNLAIRTVPQRRETPEKPGVSGPPLVVGGPLVLGGPRNLKQLLHRGDPKAGALMRSELLQQAPPSSVCTQAAEALKSVRAAAAPTCSSSSSSSNNGSNSNSKRANGGDEGCGSAERDAVQAAKAAVAAGAASSAFASNGVAASACCFCAFLPLCPRCLGALEGPSANYTGAPRCCEVCSTAPLPPAAEAARLSELLLLPLRGPSPLRFPPAMKLRGAPFLAAERLREEEEICPRGIRFARCLYTWGAQDSFLLGLPTFSCHGDSRERPPTRVPLRALSQQQQQQEQHPQKHQKRPERQQQEEQQQQQGGKAQPPQQQEWGGSRGCSSCMCISCGGPDCLESECTSVCGVFCGPGASAAATEGGGLWVWGPSAGGSTGVTVPPTPIVLEAERGPALGSGADRLTKSRATTRREGGLQGGNSSFSEVPLQIAQVALGLRHGLALVKRGAPGAPRPTETLLYAWGPDPLLGGPASAAGTGAAGASGDASAAARDSRKGPPSVVMGGPQLICQSSGWPAAQGLTRGPLTTQLETVEGGPSWRPSKKDTGPPTAGTLLPGPKGPLRLSVSSIAAGDRHALLLLDEGVVMVYGSNERGQCAQPASVPFVTRPQSLELPVIKQVAAAAAASAAFGVGPQPVIGRPSSAALRRYPMLLLLLRGCMPEVFCWGASPIIAPPVPQQQPQQQHQQQLKHHQGQQRFVKQHAASRIGDNSSSDNSSSSSKTRELFYKPLPVRFCRSPNSSGRGPQGAPGDWQEQPMGHGAPPLKWIAVSDFVGAALTSSGELCVWLSAARPAEMSLLTAAGGGPPGSPPGTRGPPLPLFESVSFGGPHQLLGRTAEGLLYSIHLKEPDGAAAAAAGAAVIAETPQLLPLAGVRGAAASSRHGAAAVSMPLPRFPVPFSCAKQQQQQLRQWQQQQESQRHKQQLQGKEEQQQAECPSLVSLCCSRLASRCAAVADLLQLAALCDRLLLPELFDFCCCSLLLNLPLFLQQQQQQQRLPLSRAACAGMQLLLLQLVVVGALRPLDCQSAVLLPEASLVESLGSSSDRPGEPPARIDAEEESLVSFSPEDMGAPGDKEGPLPRLFSAVSAPAHTVFIGPVGGPPERWLAVSAVEDEPGGGGVPGHTGKANREKASEAGALEGQKQVQHQEPQQDNQQHQRMQQKQQQQRQQQQKQHSRKQNNQQQRPQPKMHQQQQHQQLNNTSSGSQVGRSAIKPQTASVWGPPPPCSVISEAPLQQQLLQNRRQQQLPQKQQQKQQQQDKQHPRQQHEEQPPPEPQWQPAGRGGARGPPKPPEETSRLSSLVPSGGPQLRESSSPFLQPATIGSLPKASVQGNSSQGPFPSATMRAPMKVDLGSLIRVRPSKKSLTLRKGGNLEGGPPPNREAGASGLSEAPAELRRGWGPPKEAQAPRQVSMREVMEEQLQEQPREGPPKGLQLPGSASKGPTRGASGKGRGGPGLDPSCNRWGPQAAAKVQGSGTQLPSLSEIEMEEKETERALLLVAESVWFEELLKGQPPQFEGYSPPPGALGAPLELLGASPSEPATRALRDPLDQADRGGARRRPPGTQEQRPRGGGPHPPRGPRRSGGFRGGAPRGGGPSRPNDT
ncbi:hypothetical protein ACSSS7_005128 [Eimeria intestinalis]